MTAQPTPKKRRCTLCDEGTVVTAVPKDKAICQACVRKLSPDCTHECSCPCHEEPGIVHIMACCETCDTCGRNIPGAWADHDRECHAEVRRLQGLPEPPPDEPLDAPKKVTFPLFISPPIAETIDMRDLTGDE